MLVCPHCAEILEQRGQIVVACECSGSVDAERIERAQRAAWHRERTHLIQEERERRRKERRRVASSKKT